MSESHLPPSVQSTGRKKVSPLALLVGGFVGFLVLLTLIIAIATLLDDPSASDPIGPVLASQDMPNGTKLVIKQATTGTTHDLNQPFPIQSNSWFTAVKEEASISHSTPEPRVGIWMEQFEIPSFRPDELTWWRKSTIVIEDGTEIEPREYIRFGEGYTSSTTSQGEPPFSAMSTTGITPQLVGGISLFPYFRDSRAEIPVRIYGTDPKPVAEVLIPNPLAGQSFTEWKPEPLPLKATKQNVSLTLKEAKLIRKVWTSSSGREINSDHMHLELDVTREGEHFEEWTLGQIVAEDPLGNIARGSYYDRLEPEPVWKLTIPWRPKPMFEMDRTRIKEFSLEEIPTESDQFVTLTQAFTSGSTDLELFALGHGNKTIKLSGSAVNTSHARAGSAFEKSYHIDYDSNATGQTLKIDYPDYWIAAKFSYNSGIEDVLTLLVPGNGDEPIQAHPAHVTDMVIWFFPLPEGTTSLEAKLIMQKPLEFEFLIERPEIIVKE